jgi:mono/diheme cytochrome c family protein
VHRAVKIAGGLFFAGGALLLAGAGGGWMWANARVETVLGATWETHEADFPVPFPLSEAEIAELRESRRASLPPDAPPDADPLAGADLGAVALERAQERGKHLANAIFVCTACHGADLAGGTMLDDGAIGKWLGPNITRGGKTAAYKPRDFDRAVRHGVLPSGKTSLMPVGDFREMTDRELSDIVAYLDTMPHAPGSETVREFGPVGTMLIATGKLVPDVAKVADHHATHPVEPPPPGETLEFGKHVSSVCVGCHRDGLNGGPMPFGPPDWPPAANLTPEGLKGWSYEDFQKAFQRGMRPDGTPLRVPMSEMLGFTPNWTPTEVKALWMYLQSLPPTPTGT